MNVLRPAALSVCLAASCVCVATAERSAPRIAQQTTAAAPAQMSSAPPAYSVQAVHRQATLVQHLDRIMPGGKPAATIVTVYAGKPPINTVVVTTGQAAATTPPPATPLAAAAAAAMTRPAETATVVVPAPPKSTHPVVTAKAAPPALKPVAPKAVATATPVTTATAPAATEAAIAPPPPASLPSTKLPATRPTVGKTLAAARSTPGIVAAIAPGTPATPGVTTIPAGPIAAAPATIAAAPTSPASKPTAASPAPKKTAATARVALAPVSPAVAPMTPVVTPETPVSRTVASSVASTEPLPAFAAKAPSKAAGTTVAAPRVATTALPSAALPSAPMPSSSSASANRLAPPPRAIVASRPLPPPDSRQYRASTSMFAITPPSEVPQAAAPVVVGLGRPAVNPYAPEAPGNPRVAGETPIALGRPAANPYAPVEAAGQTQEQSVSLGRVPSTSPAGTTLTVPRVQRENLGNPQAVSNTELLSGATPIAGMAVRHTGDNTLIASATPLAGMSVTHTDGLGSGPLPGARSARAVPAAEVGGTRRTTVAADLVAPDGSSSAQMTTYEEGNGGNVTVILSKGSQSGLVYAGGIGTVDWAATTWKSAKELVISYTGKMDECTSFLDVTVTCRAVTK